MITVSKIKAAVARAVSAGMKSPLGLAINSRQYREAILDHKAGGSQRMFRFEAGIEWVSIQDAAPQPFVYELTYVRSKNVPWLLVPGTPPR